MQYQDKKNSREVFLSLYKTLFELTLLCVQFLRKGKCLLTVFLNLRAVIPELKVL